jgi:3-phosphoshikimate 1-carboxyvinyltransferase
MRDLVVRPVFGLKGKISLPGDKSIAHRAVFLSALTRRKTLIENFPANKDCLSTISAFKKLGIKIIQKSKAVIEVNGKGLWGLSKAAGPVFIGESGTTFRLLSGILAGQNFKTSLIAGKSLSRRPMLRVTAPLRLMGADIIARRKGKDEYPPLTIQGGNLASISYKMPVASAQVKGAILLAGLYAKGRTKVIESIPTRDHTERMFSNFQADIKANKNTIVVTGARELVSPKKIYIPGDISSAAFFMAAAAIVPNSQVLLKKVSLNPSRTGVIRVLKRMGAKIQTKELRTKSSECEPAGDIVVKTSKLKGARVKKKEIPSLIDELPVLMVAASLAEGKTVFEGVEELRVKEADRIRSISENLRKMGVDITVSKTFGLEKIIIKGVKQLKGAKVKSFGDHRTAMSMVVAGLAATGETELDDISCINKSFPEFINILDGLIS